MILVCKHCRVEVPTLQRMVEHMVTTHPKQWHDAMLHNLGVLTGSKPGADFIKNWERKADDSKKHSIPRYFH